MTNFLLETDIQQIVENLKDVSSNFSGKRILLTGGRGFLGRYFMEIFNQINNHINLVQQYYHQHKPQLLTYDATHHYLQQNHSNHIA